MSSRKAFHLCNNQCGNKCDCGKPRDCHFCQECTFDVSPLSQCEYCTFRATLGCEDCDDLCWCVTHEDGGPVCDSCQSVRDNEEEEEEEEDENNDC